MTRASCTKLREAAVKAQKLIHKLGCRLSDLGKDATDEEDTTIRELSDALKPHTCDVATLSFDEDRLRQNALCLIRETRAEHPEASLCDLSEEAVDCVITELHGQLMLHRHGLATPSLFEALVKLCQGWEGEVGDPTVENHPYTIARCAIKDNAAVVAAIERLALFVKTIENSTALPLSVRDKAQELLDAYDKAVKKEPEEQVGDYAVRQINDAIDEAENKDLPVFDNVDDLMADLNDDDEEDK